MAANILSNPCPNIIPDEFLLKLLTEYRSVQGEQETKNKLIEPFLDLLGYDIRFTSDVRTEVTCDFGLKDEKIDYVLCIDRQPKILLEAKDWIYKLSPQHINQLYRYFAATNCKLAILSNGIHYWFFSDFTKENIMDSQPFHKLNLFALQDQDREILQAICKTQQCSYPVEKYILEKKTVNLLKDTDSLSELIAVAYFHDRTTIDAVTNGIRSLL